MKRATLILFFISLFSVFAFSQSREESDSLIRLLSAKKIQLVEIDGQACRKVEGPARFLHNDTYLICDTAFWNVDKDFVDAIGHVQIIQENTLLTGDRLHYIINQDLAQFRGSLVELKDDKGNALRTEHLDYNTKDSIAFFYHGASMRDSTGNVIESVDGTYESKKSLFTFVDQVQMFSDSLFFVSDVIRYRTDLETAYFSENTMGWKNQNYFSANGGWYNRSNETLYFDKDVYGQTKDYELWCDDLFFDRVANHSILKGNIQVTDTVDGAFIFGNHLESFNEPRRVKVTQSPVMVLLIEENNVMDSVFVAADTLHYYTQRMYEVDSLLKVEARERKELALVDPVANIRKQKAEQKAAEDAKNAPNGLKPTGKAPAKNLPMTTDSLKVGDPVMAKDSVMTSDSIVIDSIKVEPPDTTEIKFLEAYHHVLIFKSDNQIKCDSLLYSDLDSMARLFKEPVIWNEIKNQLAADSMQIVIKDGEMKKGLMLGNGFLASYDSEDYYNQIKAPEMAGFFENGEISRFDALGGAQMLIYIPDSTVIAYANMKDCKIISSIMKDGNVQKNYYFESIKSNMYPVEDMTQEDHRLKGFNWRGEERPVDRFDLTQVSFRPSRRKYTLESPFDPLFDHTAKYFPGYMEDIMEQIRDSEVWIWKSSIR
ncbi:MAG: hypothetical protein J6U88_03435 [Bacteroidales bacterium]|nr:hypothetical protein [Bacteroidales bacterium]